MFTVTLEDPCLTTVLSLPTTLTATTITSLDGLTTTQVFSPATDTAATTAVTPGLCGPRIYTIVEAIPQGFTTIVPPPATSDEYTTDWSLAFQSTNLTDEGPWTVTLQAVLANYSSIAPVTSTVVVTVLNPCSGTVVQPLTLGTPTDYQIDFTVTTPVTILSFMMNTDSVGIAQSDPMICGIKSYSTGLPWLTVLVPTDPLTQNFELQVTTNDYNLTGITSVSLVVTFADVNLT